MWLADRVYSGVPAGDFGLEQVIRIGHMSGRSNIIHWLESNGMEATDELVAHLFEVAKSQKIEYSHSSEKKLPWIGNLKK